MSLANEPWLQDARLQRTLAAIAAAGADARVVGGAVRNALLGLPVGDVDIATTATPQQVIDAATAAGLKAVPTGIDHGTVTIICDGHPYEVTTLRRDVETFGRRAKVSFSTDWAADASRRDFTINALYCDATGWLFDPLGGLADIGAGRVRFIGDADQRIREDYLRILRFFRFSAQYAKGEFDRQGLAAAAAAREGLCGLSPERVRAELLRLLLAPRVVEAVAAMAATGVLAKVIGRTGALDAFARAVELDHVAPGDALLRLAALADIAATDVDRLQARLRLANAEADALRRYADAAAHVSSATVSPQQLRAFVYRHGNKVAAAALVLAQARRQVLQTPHAFQAAHAAACNWKVPRLAVTGADVIARGVPPGRRVGDILARLEAWWIATDFSADATAQREKLAELCA